MKKPTFFQCYLDNDTILSHLTDEQAGKLWKGLFSYANTSEKLRSADPMVSLAFDVMAQQIERDFTKYNEKCEKNRRNRNSGIECQRTSTTVNVCDQEEEKEENKEEDKEENKDKEEDNNKDKEEHNDKDNSKADNKTDVALRQAVEYDSTVSECTKEIIEYLNKQTGATYSHSTKSTIRLVKARLNEGYTVDDFKKVIDNRVQAWGKDKQMAQYLRPMTLFSTKFESYLNSLSNSKLSYTQVFDYDEEF